MTNGVIYSAYGKNAIVEATKSIASLKSSNADIQSCVITDAPKEFRNIADHVIEFESSDLFGRWAKLNVDILTPFKNTLYLDADTRVRGSLEPIFFWLSSGFEFVTTLSARQGESWLWHVPIEERFETAESAGHLPLQIQGGVWGFRRTATVRAFMSAWRKEWQSAGNEHDQGALMRAFIQKPMKTLFISQEFNGGVVISHYFGRAKR